SAPVAGYSACLTSFTSSIRFSLHAYRQPAEPDKEVRLACRDIFRSTKLTGKLIPLIEEVLAAGEIEPPQPAPDMLPPAIPEPETLGDSGHRGRGG
ncbi:hypothetical protein, partial [Escherichia coli]|uniref:hypothetical protein n=1 Tax=Escherichia coli TaxID=562 RepID=UPI00233F7C74